MDISLPLDKMTNLDKIAVMEKLWDDLCRDPESIPSPKWHKEVLEAGEKELNDSNQLTLNSQPGTFSLFTSPNFICVLKTINSAPAPLTLKGGSA